MFYHLINYYVLNFRLNSHKYKFSRYSENICYFKNHKKYNIQTLPIYTILNLNYNLKV